MEMPFPKGQRPEVILVRHLDDSLTPTTDFVPLHNVPGNPVTASTTNRLATVEDTVGTNCFYRVRVFELWGKIAAPYPVWAVRAMEEVDDDD